ncbi:MAG: DNA mismatch repair endonuclease MutL [Candidatus Cloacimonetes bacterium]|nr:DNA mismatch repair endonuclease MutL [Candidatus Cloacimonadota bacterium]
MGNIKVLSETVANRIAAGEVIERPASVVKELVENAIDAGAKRIIIDIEGGGKKLIRVVDNGEGMSKDDTLQAFERHATSKIRTEKDILNIATLGFRGEALPSIASVSHLQLISKNKDSETATKVEFKDGKLVDYSQTSGNQGTSITVKKLFINIPARRKFLKSHQVEFKHIFNYLHYQSILFPDIHFSFKAEGKEKLNYPIVNNLNERMLAVFGNDFKNRDLIEISQKGQDIELFGYISGLNEEKESLTQFKYLFINGRYIRDKIVLHSLKSAYEPFIKKLRIFQQGKIPPFILFLKVEPSLVDFNVHPQKLEIRFRDPGKVHSFIKLNIEKKLLEYEDHKFKQIKNKISSSIQGSKVKNLESRIFTNKMDAKRFNQVKKELKEMYQPDIFKEKTSDDLEIEKNFLKKNKDLYFRPEEDFINPWQLHQSYIFVQVEDGLMIIDQHAAHERIIYEKLLHRIHGAPAQTQNLLFPIVIDLPPHLSKIIPQLISENISVFQKAGFSIKTFSNASIVIDEIPIELEDWDGGDIFIEILTQLEDEFEQTEDFRDSLSKSVACKAAIKAGRKMNRKEMLALINDLFACEVPYFCPHGRPVIIKMTLPEFEKKFKRTV